LAKPNIHLKVKGFKMMEPQKKPSTQTNNHLITANSLPHDNDSDVIDDDYDIEQQSGDDGDDGLIRGVFTVKVIDSTE
jgi:hypothetical protein